MKTVERIERLALLANKLDAQGFYAEAELVDAMLLVEAKSISDFAKSVGEPISEISKRLRTKVKDLFNRAKALPDPQKEITLGDLTDDLSDPYAIRILVEEGVLPPSRMPAQFVRTQQEDAEQTDISEIRQDRGNMEAMIEEGVFDEAILGLLLKQRNQREQAGKAG